jgi:cytochrome c553
MNKSYLIAVVVIVLILGFLTYILLTPTSSVVTINKYTNQLVNSADKNRQQYIGAKACIQCHQQQFEAWQGSHHDMAMQHANENSVLGDFNNAEYKYNKITSTFFKKQDKYFVNTDGIDGQLQDYEIKYSFGVDPLQQYLVEMPGGRLQALSIAWDSRSKEQGGQRWFHLYLKEKVDYQDDLHWTKLSQNWNYMCAECHSTISHQSGFIVPATSQPCAG